MVRIKTIYRGRGIRTPERGVYEPKQQDQWLEQLKEPGIRQRVEWLYPQLDSLRPHPGRSRRHDERTAPANFGAEFLDETAARIDADLVNSCAESESGGGREGQHWSFGAVTGVVRDSTGAVIPGVSVEAASPALIEKTRTAISAESGQYRVEQLRPGVYTVTFTLPGFRIVRREGIEISAGFTAPVNASLEVGSVGETITVEGQAPVVDVQTISEQKTLVKEELDALPTARSFATLGTTLPGVTANQRDVGGTQGERGNVLSAHGGAGADMTLQIDGITIGNFSNGASWSTFSLNDAAVQEMVFETASISADTSSGGVRVNVIPRDMPKDASSPGSHPGGEPPAVRTRHGWSAATRNAARCLGRARGW